MATVDTTPSPVETPVDPDTRLSARILRFLKQRRRSTSCSC